MTNNNIEAQVKNEAQNVEKVSNFRRILPQVIAATVRNMLLINLGLIMTMPTICIAALTGMSNEHNRNEFLTVSAEQASWVGSIGLLFQPIGSVISTFITDPIGRKRSMILVNIPFAIGWFMLYQANAIWHVLISFATLGFAIGLMSSPLTTYLGEICEPSTRSVLTACSNINATIGMFLIYALNIFLPWRTIAAICSGLPLAAMISLCFIPETPQWLLSKNRTDKAIASLCWLRGWVSREAVAAEFSDLQRHNERSKSCNSCIKQNLQCSHPLPTLTEKMVELKRKRTLKSFAIILSLSVIAAFSGILSMRPFMVQIFKAYEVPISSDDAVVITSIIDNLATMTFMCLIRCTGKRRLYLWMLSGTFLTSFVISYYGFFCLPKGYTSFNQQHQTFHLEDKRLAMIPMICLFVWSFFSFCGITAMPWMYLSEIFAFKCRGPAVGISSTINFILGFAANKIYYNLETSLSLAGVSIFYCSVCGIGLIWMNLILPETEGRTLEDIELHFSDNSKGIIDRKIIKCTRVNGAVKNVQFANQPRDLNVCQDADAKTCNDDLHLRGTSFNNPIAFDIESKV